MLSPRYLDNMPEPVVALMSQAELDIIEDMARRIAKTGRITDSAKWQYERLKELNASYEFVQQKLQEYTGFSQGELRGIFEDAALETLSYDDGIYRYAGFSPVPLSDSPALLQIIRAGLEKTDELFSNLTRTTATASQTQFIAALDRAHMQLISGAFSYQESIKQTIKDLSAKGIAAIHYPTGHVDYLDVATRRAVLTGVNQTALKISEARADEMGADLVETTAHAGARPSHAEWQGQIFSRSGRNRKYPDFAASTGYGTGPGLGGWNCRHSFFPYFEGISQPAYNKNGLKQLDNETVKYNGQKMSLYDATQKQRYIERQIRKWKREEVGLSSAGMNAEEAKAKIKQWQSVQRDFVRQTGLRRDYFRERAGKQNGG